MCLGQDCASSHCIASRPPVHPFPCLMILELDMDMGKVSPLPAQHWAGGSGFSVGCAFASWLCSAQSPSTQMPRKSMPASSTAPCKWAPRSLAATLGGFPGRKGASFTSAGSIPPGPACTLHPNAPAKWATGHALAGWMTQL